MPPAGALRRSVPCVFLTVISALITVGRHVSGTFLNRQPPPFIGGLGVLKVGKAVSMKLAVVWAVADTRVHFLAPCSMVYAYKTASRAWVLWPMKTLIILHEGVRHLRSTLPSSDLFCRDEWGSHCLSMICLTGHVRWADGDDGSQEVRGNLRFRGVVLGVKIEKGCFTPGHARETSRWRWNDMCLVQFFGVACMTPNC